MKTKLVSISRVIVIWLVYWKLLQSCTVLYRTQATAKVLHYTFMVNFHLVPSFYRKRTVYLISVVFFFFSFSFSSNKPLTCQRKMILFRSMIMLHQTYDIKVINNMPHGSKIEDMWILRCLSLGFEISVIPACWILCGQLIVDEIENELKA